MSMRILTTSLLDLAHHLPRIMNSLLIGGGFGLYLKQNHLESAGNIETAIPGQFWPAARTTEDIDLLLPIEFVASAKL